MTIDTEWWMHGCIGTNGCMSMLDGMTCIDKSCERTSMWMYTITQWTQTRTNADTCMRCTNMYGVWHEWHNECVWQCNMWCKDAFSSNFRFPFWCFSPNSTWRHFDHFSFINNLSFLIHKEETFVIFHFHFFIRWTQHESKTPSFFIFIFHFFFQPKDLLTQAWTKAKRWWSDAWKTGTQHMQTA